MKKKIFAIVLCIAMLAIAVGGTLAYFTDTDAKTNTFTVGNIEIDLYENFTANQELIPAVVTKNDNDEVVYVNALEKEVFVKNTGSQNAYVRVHVAVPAVHNNANFIAKFGTLSQEVIGWLGTEDNGWTVSAPYSGFNIGDVPYMAYVMTYEDALEPTDNTTAAIDQVYMNSVMTQPMIEWLDETYGENVWANVYVFAEGVQSDGFGSAENAFDAAFDDIGNYTIDWTAVSERD